MKPVRINGALLCIWLLIGTAHANLTDQRLLFKKLYPMALKGQDSAVQRQRQPLQGYALDHYLDYALLSARMRQLPEADIDQFARQHPGSPLIKRLNDMFTYELGKQQQWPGYLQRYFGLGQGNKQCWYYQARIATAQTADLAPLIEGSWLSGGDLPASCQGPVKWWTSQGHLNDGLRLRRLRLAFDADNRALYQRLRQQMGTRAPAWLASGAALLQDPMQALASATAWPDDTDHRWLIEKSALLQARKRPDEFHRLWPALRAHFSLNPAKVKLIEHQLALFAATDYLPFSIGAMKSLPADMQDDQIRAWIVRYHLYYNEWPEVLDALKRMPERQLKQDRWQYWLARSLAKTGDRKAAQAVFDALAKQANYYGFLAADHLRKSYHLCNVPAAATDAQHTFSMPGAIRNAIELHHAGLAELARSEWNAAYRGMSRSDKLALADELNREGWHNKLIAVMVDLGEWRDYPKRYPLGHLQKIQQEAGKYQLIPQWIMAIIKQESAWAADAVSHAGAHGLMQIVPQTAEDLSQQLGLPFMDKRQLHQPDFNITLGVHYQNALYQRFNHPLLVAASYNAGASKAEDWLVGFPPSPDVWLETIPYRETRDYITRILSYVTIYDWLINHRPTRVSSWMPTLPVDSRPSRPWPNTQIVQQKVDAQCSP